MENNLSSRILSVESSSSRTSDSINTLQTDLTASIATLEMSIATLQSTIATLQASVATLETSVNTLQTSVTALQSSVTTLQTNLASTQTSVSTLQTNLATTTTNLATTTASATAACNLINNLGNVNDYITGRPTTNSNGILGRVAAATSLEANVDTFLAAFQTQLNAETCP